MQLGDLQAVTKGSTSLPLCRVDFAPFFALLITFNRQHCLCVWTDDRQIVLCLMGWILDKVQTPGDVHWRWLIRTEPSDMFSATWGVFRSLFDSLPVLEVADVWLKANFSQALESKERGVCLWSVAGLHFKSSFSRDQLFFMKAEKQAGKNTHEMGNWVYIPSRILYALLF